MSVPTTMADLSTTAASNGPAGSDSPISSDDYHRAIQSILRHTNAKGADIASATTTDIGAATGEFVDVTGTTTITGLGTIAAGIERTVRFTGALTLTHNATSLILPGDANITTAANDRALFRSLGSGNWLCIAYVKANGTPIALGDATVTAAKLADSALGFALINGYINVPAPSGNAQTINIKTKAGNDPSASDPVLAIFRSATITDGSYDVVSITAATSLTISSGSTLGMVNAQAARLAVLLLNNAGTVEIGINNLSGGVNLDESGVISTTAEGGAGGADSASVVYSTTARSNVAYRVAALIDVTQATAGTWASAATKVTPVGANQAAALSSLGYGQTWQDVTASRSAGATYYNTSGKPRSISVYWGSPAGFISIGGNQASPSVTNFWTVLPVPTGMSYGISAGVAINKWYEFG